MKILTTTNYSQFSSNPFQRKFRRSKVEALKKKMKDNGFIPSLAISVYRDGSRGLTVNTGHHRLAAAAELGIPVLYVIEHQWPISEMVDEGVTSSPWNCHAAAIAYARKGNKDYQDLLAYADKGIATGMAASLTIGEGAGSQNVGPSLLDGSFKIKTREKINKVVSIIEEFAGKNPAVKCRSFILTYSKCLFTKEFDDELFRKRMRSNPTTLENTSSALQMLKQIEALYNYKTANKIPLAFLVTQASNERNFAYKKGES